jgi:hypothetical protein
MRLLLALIGLLIIASSAHADAFDSRVEVGTQYGLYESYDEAEAYWSAVPGIKSVQEACGVLPQIFLINNSPEFNGYGQAAKDDAPCMIWVEAHYLKATDAEPPWIRDQDRCRLVVHELGHTLGLDHLDYGDPAKSMITDTIPKVCEAAYPPPALMQDKDSAPLCVPSWAYYGPDKALDLYLANHHREAHEAFKRWARHHRRRAYKIEGRAAFCL